MAAKASSFLRLSPSQVIHLHHKVEPVDDLDHRSGTNMIAAVGVDGFQLHSALKLVFPDL